MKKKYIITHTHILHIYIYIYIYIYLKDKHNVCKNGHKTDVQEEGGKHSPNKLKHISPLQRHVFIPLTCRILKRNHIFSTISLPFCHDWQRVQEVRKIHSRNIKMIKDDQWGTKNPYKCTNVIKQDAMDDKIQERCKTCEKQCM